MKENEKKIWNINWKKFKKKKKKLWGMIRQSMIIKFK